MVLPEEINNKDKEDEAKFWNMIVEGQTNFEKTMKNKIMRKCIMSPPKIVDGEIIITIKIPIEWIKKYVGDWNKDGVDE